jgi:rhodanese-related sulfurtransferase
MSVGTKITKDSTMQEVLEAYPSAQRALFRKYHMGGCHSCGYEPTDILADVASKHNITDINEVLNYIEEAEQIDQKIKVAPADVAAAMKSANPPLLIDVRSQMEWDIAHIPGATLISEEVSYQIMNSPKDTAMVFYCHVGQRSMDAASYFAGHGFTNVKSMTGGIEAWSQTVDTSIPRYEIARDMNTGRGVIRPLRSVVSKAEGCITP